MFNVIDSTIYTLERDYGKSFLLVTIDSVNSNNETGLQIVNKRTAPIKGVVLPAATLRKFFYDVGYLRANSNFTYGGEDDIKAISILVRKRKLPRDFESSLTYEVLYKGKRYVNVKVEDFLDGEAFLFQLKTVEGALPYNIIDTKVSDNLDLQELGSQG